MGFLPSSDAPFGPLEPLHRYILRTARPLDGYNWPYLATFPLIPLFIVAYLVQFPNTRQWRIPIGVLGIGMISQAVILYRFDNPLYMAFNNGFGISALHLIVKNVEFSIIQGPIIDPYVKRGSRSNVRAAIDLCINSRMVDLGQIHLDKESTSQKGREEAINEIGGPDGGIEMNGSRIPHKKERWLPYTNVHRSRPAATFRHFTHAIFHYIIIDTLCELLWHFGQETIANPNGIPNAIPTFLDNNPFVILPNTSNPIPVPKFVVEQLIKLFLAAGIWQGITWGYHSIAFVAVGSGIWEVESWEVDIFDAPWKTDSLLDMWGKRWHQIFRHHFLLLSTAFLRILHLPLTPPFVFPLVFTMSGLMHAVGELTMNPVPHPSNVALFFVLSGVGSAIEAGFRQVTGRRVKGWYGRIWMWIWLLCTGGMAVRAWLDAGIGGTRLVPVEWDYRSGPPIVRWLAKYCFDVRK